MPALLSPINSNPEEAEKQTEDRDEIAQIARDALLRSGLSPGDRVHNARLRDHLAGRR